MVGMAVCNVSSVGRSEVLWGVTTWAVEKCSKHSGMHGEGLHTGLVGVISLA
jgi:hypothetical protein